IGHLSGALRDMTNALYSRIEAIESFAADVAHELKNPLTSLRSAVETLPLAKSDESRARLLHIVAHDVKRLDRLISDVSDASRLDAELQRQEALPVDLTKLLGTVVTVANEVRRDDGVSITLTFEGGGARAFTVLGHDSRLGQVIDNLIENARSFSAPGSRSVSRPRDGPDPAAAGTGYGREPLKGGSLPPGGRGMASGAATSGALPITPPGVRAARISRPSPRGARGLAQAARPASCR